MKSITTVTLSDGREMPFRELNLSNGHPKRMILNPNFEIVNKVIFRIQANDGYCPCQPRSDKDDTKCPCISFITTGKCCCSLFVAEK